MPNKSWKTFERRVAKRVGGRRLPCTGEKDGVDVDARPFVYQCKLRRGLPSYLKEWLRGLWPLESAQAALLAWLCGKPRTPAMMMRL